MTGAEAHASDLLLARILSGDATDAEARATEAHAAGCARCRAGLEEARAARGRFEQFVFPRTLGAVERRVRRRRWLRIFAPLLVALPAAVAVSIVATRPEVQPEVQAKGAPALLQLFAQRGERVFAVGEGERLQRGDRLRFSVQPGSAAFVTVGSVDGRGNASLYYPSTAVAALRAEGRDAGVAGLLPGSIVLDDAPGPERIFALFSPTPLDDAQVRRALAVLAAAGPDAIRRTRALPLPFAQASILLEKGGPP